MQGTLSVSSTTTPLVSTTSGQSITLTGTAAALESDLNNLTYTSNSGYDGTDTIQSSIQDVTVGSGTQMPVIQNNFEVSVYPAESSNFGYVTTGSTYLGSLVVGSFATFQSQGGTVSYDSSTGSFDYVGNAGYSGYDSFTLTDASGTMYVDNGIAVEGTASLAATAYSGTEVSSVQGGFAPGTGGFTLMGWIEPTSGSGSLTSSGTQVINALNGSVGFVVELVYGVPTLVVHDPSLSGGSLVVSASAALAANEWANVAVTREGSVYELFVNGTQVASADAHYVSNFTSSSPFTHGGLVSTSGTVSEGFTGLMTDGAMWTTALDSSTIAELQTTALQQVTGATTGLYAEWSGATTILPNSLSDLTDASGNGHALVFGGYGSTSTPNVQLLPQTATAFNGSDAINVANINNNLPMTNVSVSAWVQLNGTQTGGDIVRLGDSGDTGAGLAVTVNSSGQLVATTLGGQTITSTASYNTDQWHYITATETNAGVISLLVDGQTITGTTTGTATQMTVDTQAPLEIGNGLSGNVANVSVWSAALTSSQIQTDMNTVLSGSESNLVSLYRLDSASTTDGTIVFTDSANGAPESGTLTGAATATLVSASAPSVSVTTTTLENSTLNGIISASSELEHGLSYSLESGPQNGTVNLIGDTYTYTPNAGYVGGDSFTIDVTDTVTGAVVTDVIGVGVLSRIQSIEVASTSASTISLAENGSYSGQITAADSGSSIVAWNLMGATIGATETLVTNHGTVVLNATDGDFTYTAGGSYQGADSFVVEVADGFGNTATQVINVNVQSAISVTGSTTLTTTTSQAIAGTLGVTDSLSSSTVTGTLVGSFTSSGATETLVTSHGTVTFNTATLQYDYISAASFVGIDSFTVALTDNDGTTATDQTIYVDVNASASIAAQSNVTLAPLASHTFDLAATNLTQGTVGGDAFVATITVGSGTLSDSNQDVTVTSSNGGETLVLSGGYAQIEQALAQVVYTANSETTVTSDNLSAVIDVNGTLAASATANISITGSDPGPTLITAYGNFIDGGTDYVAITNRDGLVTSQTTNVTVESLINWNGSTGTYGSFIFNNGWAAESGYGLRILSGGTISLLYGANYNATATNSGGTVATISANQWDEVALVITSTGVANLYVNGSEYSFGQTNLLNASIGGQTVIGNWYASGDPDANEQGYSNDQGFQGEIASVAFWNDVRSGTQIYSDLAAPNLNDPNLAGYYALNSQTLSSDTFTQSVGYGSAVTALTGFGGSPVTGQIMATALGGDAITYGTHTAASHGTVTYGSNGAFTYTPTQGYYGTDSFVASITAGGTTVLETIGLVSALTDLNFSSGTTQWSGQTIAAGDLITVSNYASLYYNLATATSLLGFTLEDGGALNIASGTLNILSASAADDSSTISLQNGAALTVASGAIITDGGAFNVSGTASIGGTGTLTVGGELTIANGGQLNVTGGDMVAAGGLYTTDQANYESGTATIAGAGTLVVTAGVHENLIINGNLNFDGSSEQTYLDYALYGTGSVTNSGSLYVEGGVTVDPTFTNEAGGVLYLSSEVTFSQSMVNDGIITLYDYIEETSGGMTVNGTFTNAGTISPELSYGSLSITADVIDNGSTGHIDVSNHSDLNLISLLGITNEGTIGIEDGGTINLGSSTDINMDYLGNMDNFVNSGLIEGGSGTNFLSLHDVSMLNNGTIEVSSATAAGVLDINGGNVILESASDLIIHTRDTSSDLLSVGGTLTLGGTLNLDIVSQPTTNDEIVSAEQILGSFETINGLFDPSHQTYLLDPTFTSDAIDLTAETLSQPVTQTSTTLMGEYLLSGTNGDTLVGNNSETGTSYGAVLLGQGSGNDTFEISSTDFNLIKGGTGFNSLIWNPSETGATTMDLGKILPGLVENVQEIDLSKVTGATVTLDAAHVEAMTQNTANTVVGGTTPTVLVYGAAGEQVSFTDAGWTTTNNTQSVSTPDGHSDSYTVYSNSSAHVQVLVEHNMSVHHA